jgi:hypothetical protein
MSNPAIFAELQRIAGTHGGMLHAADVVDAARNPQSILHTRFQWDDSKAAEQYRLFQARQLIRVVVTYIGDEDAGKLTRAYVSLTPDRTRNAGGGYHKVNAVLEDDSKRDRMLQDALEELARFRRKYSEIRALAQLMTMIGQVMEEVDLDSPSPLPPNEDLGSQPSV